MDHARLNQLLDAYLDNRLTEADRAALGAELTASPDACRVFWDAVHQHALLAELVAEARGMALARQDLAPPEVKLFVPGDEPAAAAPAVRPGTRVVRVLRRLLGLSAAVLLLALGVSWLAPPDVRQDDPTLGKTPALARLGELHGIVHIVADLASHPARSGEIVHPGQEVHTGEGSSAVVTYDDSSRFELSADTSVQLLAHAGPETSPGGKRLFLVKGVVNADVAPQPHGLPMVFSTTQVDMLAPAARFSSASVLDETRIELESGNARLTRKGDPRTVEIFTGSYAVAASDGLINPAPMVPSSGEPYATFNEASGPVLGLAVVNNQMLAVGCFNGLVKLWDLRTRKVRGKLDAHRARTLALACTQDGRTLAVGYEDKSKQSGVVLWDLPDRRMVSDLPGTRSAFAMDFTPDGQTLALASRSKRGVIVWDTGDRRERIVLGERMDGVRSLAISPDGCFVAAGGAGGKIGDTHIRLWNLQTGRVETILEGHQREVQALAFQPNGNLLASGSRDGVVRLWSLPAGDEVRTLSGNFKEVRCLTFSPDGRTLATSHGGMVILWDVATGKQRSTLKAHKFAITALVYLPDGRTLATAGWDRTVKLWDLQPAE